MFHRTRGYGLWITPDEAQEEALKQAMHHLNQGVQEDLATEILIRVFGELDRRINLIAIGARDRVPANAIWVPSRTWIEVDNWHDWHKMLGKVGQGKAYAEIVHEDTMLSVAAVMTNRI